MKWAEEFDKGCEAIELQSLKLDEDISIFCSTQLALVKDQLPKMLRVFHKQMRHLLRSNEASSKLE